LLAHIRLGALLSFLSSAMLLNTRLSLLSSGRPEFKHAQVPLASLYFASSLCAILAGTLIQRNVVVKRSLGNCLQAGGRIEGRCKISSGAKLLLASSMCRLDKNPSLMLILCAFERIHEFVIGIIAVLVSVTCIYLLILGS
jgi:hypothetical protein